MSVIYQTTSTVIDHKTGEALTSEKTNKVAFPKEPSYVKLYIEDIGSLMGLTTVRTDLLYSLIKIMSYDGNIRITKTTKDRICEQLGIKDGTIRKALCHYCEKGIFKRLGTGEYEANPNYFAKGDWVDIRKRQNDFELKIKYTKNGKREIKGKAI